MTKKRIKRPFSPTKLAHIFNLGLKHRRRPPRSVARTTVYNWIAGERAPDYLMLEHLAEHADEESVRQRAAELLAYLDEQNKAE